MLAWVTVGHTDAAILEALRAQFPDADPKAVLRDVTERLEAEGSPNADAVRGWALLAYRELYRRMVEIGDFAGALKAVKETVALAG